MQPRIENIDGIDHLIVAIPMQEPTVSGTGKSLVVAKTATSKTGIKYQTSGKEISYSGSAWIKK